MNLFKNKKYLFILLLSAFGLCMILAMTIAIIDVISVFGPEDKLADSTNIAFSLKSTPAETTKKSPKPDDLKNKAAVYENTKVIDNKTLSFKIKQTPTANAQPTSYPTQQIPQKNSNLSTLLNQQQSSHPTPPQHRPTKTPSAEETLITQQLRELYIGQSTPVNTNATTSTSATVKELTPIERRKRAMEQGFSTSHTNAYNQNSQQVVNAVIHGTQTIKERGNIVLRLTTPGVTDNNTPIPVNTIVYGRITGISSNRLMIDFTSVNLNGILHPFAYKLYSMDGQPGIYLNIPSKEVEDAVKEQSRSQVRTLTSRNAIASAAMGVIDGISNAASRENRIEITLTDSQRFHLIK